MTDDGITRRAALGGLALAMAGLGRAAAAEARTAESLAGRLHDRVRDGIAFGWGPHFYHETPAESEARGVGYCVTQSAALVATLRAAGLEARMVFAEIDAAVLRGLIDPGTERVDHAFVELRLGGAWIGFDSHVVDRPLVRASTARLAAEGRPAGWATRAAASDVFPGWSQFVPALRGRIWGPFEDIDAFLESDAVVHNRLPWFVRTVFGAVAGPANARAEAPRRAVG